MEWLSENLAVISGIFVPLLLAIVRPIVSGERSSRDLKRVEKLASLRELIKENKVATIEIDKLISVEVENLVRGRIQKVGMVINKASLIAMLFVALIGGGASYLLVLGAQATEGILSYLLWVVFYVLILFVILLVFVGGGKNFYKKNDSSK